MSPSAEIASPVRGGTLTIVLILLCRLSQYQLVIGRPDRKPYANLYSIMFNRKDDVVVGFRKLLKLSARTLYSTSEACRLAYTNCDNYLPWVREGKFPDVMHRDMNGWKLFTNGDIDRLKAKVSHIDKVQATRMMLVSHNQRRVSSEGVKNDRDSRRN